MSRLFSSHRWMHVFVIGAVLLATLGLTTAPTALAQTSCGTTYTVQRGDNLTEIANLCGTTLNALLQANPQIIDPNLIYPGQIINIPTNIIPITGGQAQVQIAPQSGLAGTQLTVSGAAFPANTVIYVTAGPQGASPVLTVSATTDANGSFTTFFTVPDNAQAGSLWNITATAQASGIPSVTTQFQVIAQLTSGPYTVQSGDTLSSLALRFGVTVNALIRANSQIANINVLTPGQQIYIPGTLVTLPSGKEFYVVRTGDYLSEIADRLGITYAALLQANPQIANPSLIFPGQHVSLPAGIIPITGEQTQLLLNPASGVAGSQVTVSGLAFPANVPVNVVVGLQGASPVSTFSVNTDGNGSFTTQVTIPSSAQAGGLWNITAATQTGGGPSATAQFLVVAAAPSSPYVVKSGDTLASIASLYGVTVNDLIQTNPQITNPSSLTPGQEINIPSRISFAPGGTSTVVAGNLSANSTFYYVLNAQANQILQVNLAPVSGITLAITGADGTEVMSASSGELNFRGHLPNSGDYILTLSAQNQAVAYTLNVSIPARISFAAGGTSAQVAGALAANGSQYYILRAQANQTMEVNVTPQQGVQLSVYGVDGTVLKNGMSNAASFSGTLPSTQDYILALASGNQPVSYSMTVTIPSGAVIIPNTGQEIYIVQPGDYLTQIARRFNTNVSALLQANPQISNPSLIYPGEQIVIP